MTAAEWATIAPVVASLAALATVAVTYLALRAAIRFRSELSLSEQISNVPDLYVKEYLDRQFSTPLFVDTQELHTLKEARALAKEEIKPRDNETPEQARERFLNATLGSGWENKFAYELSLALERVGAMVLAGAIPLELVLAINGDQIVDDWMYCSRFIEKRLRNPQVAPTSRVHDTKNLYYHRRHGEWLAYAAAIWLFQKWEGGHLRDLEATFENVETMRKRERELRRIDSELIPEATQKSLRKILGG